MDISNFPDISAGNAVFLLKDVRCSAASMLGRYKKSLTFVQATTLQISFRGEGCQHPPPCHTHTQHTHTPSVPLWEPMPRRIGQHSIDLFSNGHSFLKCQTLDLISFFSNYFWNAPCIMLQIEERQESKQKELMFAFSLSSDDLCQIHLFYFSFCIFGISHELISAILSVTCQL